MRKKTMTVVPERREKQKNDIWLSTATDFFFCLLCLFRSIGLFSALPAVGEMGGCKQSGQFTYLPVRYFYG